MVPDLDPATVCDEATQQPTAPVRALRRLPHERWTTGSRRARLAHQPAAPAGRYASVCSRVPQPLKAESCQSSWRTNGDPNTCGPPGFQQRSEADVAPKPTTFSTGSPLPPRTSTRPLHVDDPLPRSTGKAGSAARGTGPGRSDPDGHPARADHVGAAGSRAAAGRRARRHLYTRPAGSTGSPNPASPHRNAAFRGVLRLRRRLLRSTRECRTPAIVNRGTGRPSCHPNTEGFWVCRRRKTPMPSGLTWSAPRTGTG